jgi:hypothetical protein
MRLLSAVALAAWVALPACTSAPQPASSPAFFRVAPQETALVHAFAREQERQVQNCAKGPSCVRARYLQGLAALYENRTAARTHFQAVLASEPNGPYAVSSRAWLRLLGGGLGESVRDGALVQAVERVVRDVLEGETAIRQAASRPEREDKQATVLRESQAVQSLKRQLKEREQEVEMLTEQIEALKRVDQEVRERVKPGRQAD